MKAKTLAQIYCEAGRMTCFRFRDVGSLDDWLACNNYEWTWDHATNLPVRVKAMNIEGELPVVKEVDAELAKYTLLSTKAECEYLKSFATQRAYSLVREPYRQVSEHPIYASLIREKMFDYGEE